MTSEHDVIADGELRAPRSHGICRAPSCPVAEEAKPVELYPGPGEYCPECGALLEPIAAVPAAAAVVTTAVEAAAPPAASPPAVVDVAAPAITTAARAATTLSGAEESPPDRSDALPARAERELSRPESPVRTRATIAIGLIAIAAAGGIAAVRSMTARPVASIAVRARPSSAPYPIERSVDRLSDGPATLARTGGAISPQVASTPQATISPISVARPTPAPLPSVQPTATSLATPLPTPTPTSKKQRSARKETSPSAPLGVPHRDAHRPGPVGTLASSKIGGVAVGERPQPESTQAGAVSLPATSLAVEPTVPMRPTATPLSCARPDTPPAIVSAAVPETPPMAEQQGIFGVVHVIVSLNAQSRVVATRVQNSPSVLLNHAALAAARTSQFRTQIVSCEPVAADYVLDVNFTR